MCFYWRSTGIGGSNAIHQAVDGSMPSFNDHSTSYAFYMQPYFYNGNQWKANKGWNPERQLHVREMSVHVLCLWINTETNSSSSCVLWKAHVYFAKNWSGLNMTVNKEKNRVFIFYFFNVNLFFFQFYKIWFREVLVYETNEYNDFVWFSLSKVKIFSVWLLLNIFAVFNQ